MARSASLARPRRLKLVSYDLPVIAIDDGGQVSPAVIAAVDVGDIDGSGAHRSGKRWRPDP